MPSTCCCVPSCSYKGGHVFPKNEKLCKEWIRVVRRAKWAPNKHSVVCKRHFKPGDYLEETVHGTIPLLTRLKQNAVPSVFPWTKEETEMSSNRKQRAARRSLNLASAFSPASVSISREETENVPEPTIFLSSEEIDVCEVTVESPLMNCRNVCTQTQMPATMCTVAVQTSVRSSTACSLEKYRNDPLGIHFYTGLECYEKVIFVLNTLGEAAYNLTFLYGAITMDVADQFFMTLIKLRQNKTCFELSRMFLISERDVYNIFCTWVRFMSLQWRELNIFPSKQCVGFYSPTDFKKKFPNTRVIVDGTECPIQKPKKPTAQPATFSTYKNRNTVKTLIGTSPGGMVTYVSDSYGGSTSDRQIIERSDLPWRCSRGDSIMADKGFDVQDLMAPHGIQVNMPAFFSKVNRISSHVVRNDRKIASKRVHVERSIGLGKTYTILTKPMCHSEVKISSDIIFVCFMLCNFRENIVGPDA